MINKKHASLSIRQQCQLLSLHRSAFYYQPAAKSQEETALANEIYELWMRLPFYGYRRITADLNRQGYEVNHKRVQRLMKETDLKALCPKRRTTIPNKDHMVYPLSFRGNGNYKA